MKQINWKVIQKNREYEFLSANMGKYRKIELEIMSNGVKHDDRQSLE
jgi:hypothetical protein